MIDANKFTSCLVKALIIIAFLQLILISIFGEKLLSIGGITTISKNNSNNNIVDGLLNHNVKKLHYEPFNHTNPYENSWCPTAQCYNSPICTPCNQRFLFIIATGRSGSTTLLRMFNQLPNVRLSGENYNAIYKASALPRLFVDNATFFMNNETISEGKYYHDTVENGPFAHNAIPLGSMACVMQHVIKHLNPPNFRNNNDETLDQTDSSIIGAKIIRIPNGKWSPQEAASFFKTHFPCSRFIINVRSKLDDQLKSMYSAFHWEDPDNITIEEKNIIIEEKMNKLQNQTQFLMELNNELGERLSRFIDMEQWKDNVKVLNDIVTWLGFKKCAFNAIFHENFDNYKHDLETQVSLGNNCKYL